MAKNKYITLKIFLPYQVFAEINDVTQIIAEGHQGFFGLLPQRLDCVSALVPGIFTYHSDSSGEVYLAIDEGILVKTGSTVMVSVRSAIGGVPLDELQQVVEREFMDLDKREQNVRSVLKKMEAALSTALRGIIMDDRSHRKNPDAQSDLGKKIGIKAARRIKAANDKTSSIWFGLGMMGIVGWSVVVPTLLGTALGRWIDQNTAGSYSWTLMLLIIGLVIGCLTAWYWLKKEEREINRSKEDNHDE